MFELLDSVVKEIGKDNVVQVVTDMKLDLNLVSTREIILVTLCYSLT